MTLKRIPEIKWNYTQAEEPFPKVPGSGLILGPTGSGKSSLAVQMILQPYKDVFSRIYVFSPSVDIDDLWIPVKKHVTNYLEVDETKEQTFFSIWDEAALENIMTQQAKMIKHLKENRKNIITDC